MYVSRKLITLFLGLIVLSPVCAFAQARSYQYDLIVVNADVQADSTVRIDEELTYRFIGGYHQGYRAIPHKALGAITDIRVVDKATGKDLAYSPDSLTIDDPASWGKYTYYEQDGSTVIEWYFDLKDTTHTWDIIYTVHGALGFYRDHDELYWNMFTEYEVPVEMAQAVVRVPGAITQPSATFYIEPEIPYLQKQADDRTYMFTVAGVPANAKLTFAVGWQKGLVSQKEYWKDFLRINILYVAAALVVLASVFAAFAYEIAWRRRVHGKGAIIPQYEPPRHLPPAEAQLIVKGKMTPEAWSATVVDLAVRGYLTIDEDKKEERYGIISTIASVIAVVFVGIVGLIIVAASGIVDAVDPIFILLGFFALFVVLPILGIVNKRRKGTSTSSEADYVVRRTAKPDTDLKPYEQEYMKALSPRGGDFSTERLRDDTTASQALYKRVVQVEKILKNSIQVDTHAFARPPFTIFNTRFDPSFGAKDIPWKWFPLILVALFGIPIVILLLFAFEPARGLSWFVGAVLLCAIFLFYWTSMKIRLNAEGEILKEEWLGFKLYLEKAEQYRLQNLTPDTFEKYLPYAIIFGVEKQWGKAFASMTMPQPTWYHATAHSGVASSAVGASNFSASAFSASFSSSFSSAFSSAGGGGASGGGGGAGGGGGGGGGGAH